MKFNGLESHTLFLFTRVKYDKKNGLSISALESRNVMVTRFLTVEIMVSYLAEEYQPRCLKSQNSIPTEDAEQPSRLSASCHCQYAQGSLFM